MFDRLGKFACQLVAVKRMNDVEQRHRLGGLVALQRADLLRLLAICGSRPVFDVAPSPRRICRQTPVKA
jgi:hypothetical protein